MDSEMCSPSPVPVSMGRISLKTVSSVDYQMRTTYNTQCDPKQWDIEDVSEDWKAHWGRWHKRITRRWDVEDARAILVSLEYSFVLASKLATS